jgi:hypothetical protein
MLLEVQQYELHLSTSRRSSTRYFGQTFLLIVREKIGEREVVGHGRVPFLGAYLDESRRRDVASSLRGLAP